MQDSILYDHFTTIPDIRSHFPRSRIDELLVKVLEGGLAIVTAGAGWGKTQAVSSFMQQSDADFVWLQFSKLDNYTVRFWENFTHAVSAKFPKLAYRLSAFGFPDTAALFHNFLHVFADYTIGTDKLILVFDDIHLMNDPFILNFVENLLYARLKNVTIILVGRALPDLDLNELHRDDATCQITEEDLRFTKKEAMEYFEDQEITLPEDIFEKIYSGAEGWISALYLISLTLKEKEYAPQNILIIAKQQLFELIELEIFSKYSEETKQMLVEWAFFERIPIGFVKKSLIESSNLMNEIEKTNLFIRFNHLTQTYDIHHLFLEFLQSRQSMYLTNEDIEKVHYQIADWNYKNGSKIEALTHYRQCGHYEEIWEIIRHYEMQTPVAVSKLFLELLEEFPKQLWEKHPLIYIIQARLYLMVGRLQESIGEFMKIVHTYEALPPTAENKAMLGEVFIYLGMISQLSFDYKFTDYFKKAAEYLPQGSSLVDNKFGYSDGNFMVLINKNTAGEMERFVNATMETMPYCAKAMNGAGYGVEYVTKAEADYYTNNMKEAESAAYTAIYKAEQQQQYDTICAAYFVLVCVYVSDGNHNKVTECIEQLDGKITAALETDSENSSNVKRYVYTYTVLKSWYYAAIRCYDKIPDWIVKQDARHKVPSAGYYLRDEFIHAYCLLDNQNYQELSGLLEALEDSYNMTGLLIARLYTKILKAFLFQKTGNIPNAMEVFGEAYELAYANSIVMPFIEYGKYMRALIYTARRSEENTIPDVWLDEIYTKATTYEKHLNNMRSQYMQAAGLAADNTIELTKRESEMLSYLCQGLTSKEISGELFVSVSLVKKTCNHIYAKLGATNKADAVRIAVQMGLDK